MLKQDSRKNKIFCFKKIYIYILNVFNDRLKEEMQKIEEALRDVPRQTERLSELAEILGESSPFLTSQK